MEPMGQKSKVIDLTDEQLKKIAGGGDDSFSFSCLECGTTFTVSNSAMEARCPNCGEEYYFAVTDHL